VGTEQIGTPGDAGPATVDLGAPAVPVAVAPVPSPAASGFRTTLRAFDVEPFRALFASNFLFFNAQFIFLASQQWLIVNLTDSRTLLGMAGFAQGIAMMLLGPFAGVVTDRVPRRHILAGTRGFLVLVTGGVGLLAALDVIAVWHVLLVALLVGVTQAASQPATQTYVFDIVPSDRVANAVALNSANTGTSQMIGPSLGGLLIAAIGIAAGYFASSVFYFFAMLLLFRIAVVGEVQADARRPFFQEMREGAREAYRNPVVRWSLLLVTTSFAVAAVQALRPVYAKDVFDVGAFGFGMLSAAFGVGGIAGAVLAANLTGRVANKGLMLVVSGCVFYVGEILYGLSPVFATTLAVEFLMGMAATCWSSTAFPLIQMAVPQAMRGRVMSLVFTILPGAMIGQLGAGALADAVGPRSTLVAFGLVALAVHVYALVRGELVRAAAKVHFG
jgi:MFS family permease